MTDLGCGAVLADQMSAGAGGYLPEGRLIIGCPCSIVWRAVGVDLTYAMDDVIGEVNDVGEVTNVIGRRDGSSLSIPERGIDSKKAIVDMNSDIHT